MDTSKTEGQHVESSYVHGGQRPLENPPESGAKDVSLPVQDELDAMHVESKLDAQTADGQEVRSEPDQAELEAKRAEGFKQVEAAAQVRAANAEAISGVSAATRDRTLAVQEEIATRERDGVVAGTPAFERRKERLREIVGQTEESPEISHADRIRSIAARMHTASPSGTEELQHELMVLADEMGATS